MDKKTVLKNEIIELEGKARITRNKNLDAQKESDRLHREKVEIIRSTTDLRRQQKEEKERRDKLSKKAAEKEAEFNAGESERKATKDALDKKAKDLKLLQTELDDIDKDTTKRIAITRESEKKLKGKKADFEDEKIAFAKEKAQHEREYADFDEKKKARSTENANLEARKKVVTRNENAAIENLDKTKGIKEQWQSKLDAVNRGQAILDKDKKDFAQKKGQYDKDKEQLTLDQEEVTKGKEANEGKKAGLIRGRAELEKDKDVVRRDSLRVEKLIREKGVKKEIETLEKELKK